MIMWKKYIISQEGEVNIYTWTVLFSEVTLVVTMVT